MFSHTSIVGDRIAKGVFSWAKWPFWSLCECCVLSPCMNWSPRCLLSLPPFTSESLSSLYRVDTRFALCNSSSIAILQCCRWTKCNALIRGRLWFSTFLRIMSLGFLKFHPSSWRLRCLQHLCILVVTRTIKGVAWCTIPPKYPTKYIYKHNDLEQIILYNTSTHISLLFTW